MGDHNESERNKNESESEMSRSEILDRLYELDLAVCDNILSLQEEIKDILVRIKALEGVFMRRFAPDTAEHPNDGGWFC